MWTTAKLELRNLIADNSSDKLRYKKRVIGIVNGTNKVFKTFERRRITDFTDGTLSQQLGVFVDGVKQTVVTDSPVIGEFS